MDELTLSQYVDEIDSFLKSNSHLDVHIFRKWRELKTYIEESKVNIKQYRRRNGELEQKNDILSGKMDALYVQLSVDKDEMEQQMQPFIARIQQLNHKNDELKKMLEKTKHVQGRAPNNKCRICHKQTRVTCKYCSETDPHGLVYLCDPEAKHKTDCYEKYHERMDGVVWK